MVATKWEYKRVTTWGLEGTRYDERASAALTSEYGEKGWELVAAFFHPGEGYVYCFKRPIASSQPPEQR